ncbi:gephyrin-like isoform X5 [Eriocheir sinensis]|uniref:gephyrin-like isoform X5 n=1 Tax=Eriocheir sinensis TaxID=95602 RepID=UPI0021CA8C11|nr:gephyrin-like isoform X5 [Eriocheir sinensis]
MTAEVYLKQHLYSTGEAQWQGRQSREPARLVFAAAPGGHANTAHFIMPQVIKVGVLTVSDRCSQGKAQDEGGANLKALVDGGALFKGKVCKYSCVSDDHELIRDKLMEWCSEEVQLILTTGGTGFAQRDVTPEAVKEQLEGNTKC